MRLGLVAPALHRDRGHIIRRATAERRATMLTKDEARTIAAKIARLTALANACAPFFKLLCHALTDCCHHIGRVVLR
jgi:hypothetical protein